MFVSVCNAARAMRAPCHSRPQATEQARGTAPRRRVDVNTNFVRFTDNVRQCTALGCLVVSLAQGRGLGHSKLHRLA